MDALEHLALGFSIVLTWANLGYCFLGVLIGGLGDLYRHFQLKKTLRQNQRMIERLEREIQSLSGLRFEKSSSLKENYEVR